MSFSLDPNDIYKGASYVCDSCGARTLPISEFPWPLGWSDDMWPRHFCPQCVALGKVDAVDRHHGEEPR